MEGTVYIQIAILRYICQTSKTNDTITVVITPNEKRLFEIGKMYGCTVSETQIVKDIIYQEQFLSKNLDELYNHINDKILIFRVKDRILNIIGDNNQILFQGECSVTDFETISYYIYGC